MKFRYTFKECPAGCPKCGNTDVVLDDATYYVLEWETKEYYCPECGFRWLEEWQFWRWEVIE